MKPATSCAELPATQVRAACMLWLSKRVDAIERMQEAAIDKEMARRFFRPKTRPAARKLLEASGLCSDWGLMKLHGGWHAHRVEQLLALANSGALTLFVCAEDAEILCPHLAAEACIAG